MAALLALLDSVVASLGDEASTSAIHARAAELRRDAGPAASSLVRALSVVRATSERLGLSLSDAFELIGERAVPLLAPEMALQMRHHGTAHTFCLHLNEIVQSELQAMVPTVQLPFIDVEMLDFSALRLSFIGDENALALARGLLGGVARNYGQNARFDEVPESMMCPVAHAAGRRYVDICFVDDSRTQLHERRPPMPDRRRGALAVALKGLFG